jgi:16S rRNA (cytosine1402-N4)-methyltransferase
MTDNVAATRTEKTHHVPVFLDAVLGVLRELNLQPKTIFDGTFGRGGHSLAFLNEWPESKLVAFDWDIQAIRFGEERFAELIAAKRLKLVHASYADFARQSGLPASFDLMLLDLGVSSPQLDQADRGFSFYHDGPLDMRMDQAGELKASDIVNEWDEQDLARLFIEYGEVQRPFRVARAIVQDRKAKKPFATTRELASMIERVDGWQKKGSHPATRYFLALRLKVNEELKNVERALPDLIQGLAPGGILAVITFHSLEDRIVKNVFKAQLHLGNLVNKKVIKPSDEEVKSNPRARSAKLRVFQRHDRRENQGHDLK